MEKTVDSFAFDIRKKKIFFIKNLTFSRMEFNVESFALSKAKLSTVGEEPTNGFQRAEGNGKLLCSFENTGILIRARAPRKLCF